MTKDFHRVGADRLAYAVARLIQTRVLDARSEAADALLDYLDVGGIDGPKNVLEWMEQYEARRAKENVNDRVV